MANNIFSNMDIPQLGAPDFQTNFQDFCSAIVENIQRLISVQYVKGEAGSSVINREIIVKYDWTDQTDPIHPISNTLCPLGRILVNTIFDPVNINPDHSQPEDWTNSNVTTWMDNQIAPVFGNNVVWRGLTQDYDPNGEYKIEVSINIDEESHKAYLANPFILIDGRIVDLAHLGDGEDAESIRRAFIDFSTAVYGIGEYMAGDQDPNDPTTWTWTLHRVNIIPKIYYDDQIHEFCWNINGQNTGISAQGITGEVGESIHTWVCKGDPDGGPVGAPIFLNITEVLDETTDGVAQFVRLENYAHIPAPSANDLALVFWQPANGIERVFFGPIRDCGTGGVQKQVKYLSTTDIFECYERHSVWYKMWLIDSGNSGIENALPSAPRGYIIPDPDPQVDESYEEFVNDDNVTQTVHVSRSHMIWNEKGNLAKGKLISSPIEAANWVQTASGTEPDSHVQLGATGDWDINYNTNVQGNSYVQGSGLVQGNMTVQGTTNLQGELVVPNQTISNGTTNHALACVSKFKDVRYRLERELSYDRNENSHIDYQIIISGVLELNIGKLSNPISSLFSSKKNLYDIITYNIPFNQNYSIQCDKKEQNDLILPHPNRYHIPGLCKTLTRNVDVLYGSVPVGVNNEFIDRDVEFFHIFSNSLLNMDQSVILEPKDNPDILPRIIIDRPIWKYNDEKRYCEYEIPDSTKLNLIENDLDGDIVCKEDDRTIWKHDVGAQGLYTRMKQNQYFINKKIVYEGISIDINFLLYPGIFEYDIVKPRFNESVGASTYNNHSYNVDINEWTLETGFEEYEPNLGLQFKYSGSHHTKPKKPTDISPTDIGTISAVLGSQVLAQKISINWNITSRLIPIGYIRATDETLVNPTSYTAPLTFMNYNHECPEIIRTKNTAKTDYDEVGPTGVLYDNERNLAESKPVLSIFKNGNNVLKVSIPRVQAFNITKDLQYVQGNPGYCLMNGEQVLWEKNVDIDHESFNPISPSINVVTGVQDGFEPYIGTSTYSINSLLMFKKSPILIKNPQNTKHISPNDGICRFLPVNAIILNENDLDSLIEN